MSGALDRAGRGDRLPAMMTALSAARVRVPCSTSNLGAGFDCIGLALDRHLDVEFTPAAVGGIRVERGGTLENLHVGASGDAVAAAFIGELKARGRANVHGELRMSSSIPVGRGLGSSAAATVAGLVLAHAATGSPIEAARIFETATKLEGHPDNAAPALYGGLVGVAATPDERIAFRLSLSSAIGFAWAAPPVEVSTAWARRALPASVDHSVAVRSLSRVASLVHGLATGDARLLRAGFADELHVPYRLASIPGAAAAIESALEAGAWAVTISGSGSGLLAVGQAGGEAAVAAAMARAFEALPAEAIEAAATGDSGSGVIAFAARPSWTGASVLVQDGFEAVASLEGS
jgi:homoserine kinase